MKEESKTREWDYHLQELLSGLSDAYNMIIVKYNQGEHILKEDEFEINLKYEEILNWLRKNKILPVLMKVTLMNLIEQSQLFKDMRIISEERLWLKKSQQTMDKMKEMVDKYGESVESHRDTFDLILKLKNRYDDYTEKLRYRIKKTNDRLRSSDIRYSFYYTDYENIKVEVDKKQYNKDERSWANNLGLGSFMGWKYAFYILVYRNIKESIFRKLFSDENFTEISLEDNDSIEWFFPKFHNAYTVWRNRKQHTKTKSNKLLKI